MLPKVKRTAVVDTSAGRDCWEEQRYQVKSRREKEQQPKRAAVSARVGPADMHT